MKRHDREPVLINPQDANRLGISDGDIVCLHNQRGQCLATATVSDDIMPRVLFLWTGAWFDPDFDHPQHLDRHGNPNVLTHDHRTSTLSHGPASHSALVFIQRFDEEAPAVKAFDPPIYIEKIEK